MGVRGLVVGEGQQSAVLEMAVWRVLTMRWGGRLKQAQLRLPTAAVLSPHGLSLRQRSTERQSFFAPSPRGLTAAQNVFRHRIHTIPSIGPWLATTTT